MAGNITPEILISSEGYRSAELSLKERDVLIFFTLKKTLSLAAVLYLKLPSADAETDQVPGDSGTNEKEKTPSSFEFVIVVNIVSSGLVKTKWILAVLDGESLDDSDRK